MWDKKYAVGGVYLPLSSLGQRMTNRQSPCPPTRLQSMMAMELETLDEAVEDWFRKKTRCQ